MDPISQAVAGTAAAQSFSTARKIAAFSVLGAAAGLAPDLDVLIRSDVDPLLYLEFHRQFTHALIFIPIGALLVAAAFHWLFRRTLKFRESYLACLLGYATHGLLDACTTYGTQLFWPFSNARVSWNVVSVIDPLFTLPALALVLLAAIRRKPAFGIAALTWAGCYLMLGLAQQQRAWAAVEHIANERDHLPVRLSVKPAFANILLWKVIYEHDDRYYVNAVRTLDEVSWCPGTIVDKLDVAQQLPELSPDSRQARDIERFRWFSQDFLALHGRHNLVVDVRYSAVPNEVEPLWGIRVDPSRPDQHAEWWAQRSTNAEQLARLRALLAGDGCDPVAAGS